MARLDLVRPTARIASYVTKLCSYRDTPLQRLVCYIWSTLDYVQGGRIPQRDTNIFLQIVAYSDAGFAGCVTTLRSTTGGHLCLEGRSSHCPIPSLSKQQVSTAASSPEAEQVAAESVIRQMRIPSLDMWGIVSPQWGHAY